MRIEHLVRVKEILDESITWESEVLREMPRLFLLLRENYLRSLDAEQVQAHHVQIENRDPTVNCGTVAAARDGTQEPGLERAVA
jgi:hypothetical protein